MYVKVVGYPDLLCVRYSYLSRNITHVLTQWKLNRFYSFNERCMRCNTIIDREHMLQCGDATSAIQDVNARRGQMIVVQQGKLAEGVSMLLRDLDPSRSHHAELLLLIATLLVDARTKYDPKWKPREDIIFAEDMDPYERLNRLLAAQRAKFEAERKSKEKRTKGPSAVVRFRST